MNITELIEQAVRAKGNRKSVAEGLNQDPQRLTDWKAGRRKPDANEIAYLAEVAGLPIFETVAEIEAGLNSRYAPIWQAALGKLRAAEVAATVTLTLSNFSLTIIMPSDAQARSEVRNRPEKQPNQP